MTELLARGYITIAAVSDGYSLSLTAASVSIPANHDGSNPDLEHAETTVTLSHGNDAVAFDVVNVIPSSDGIKYTYKNAGECAWNVTIIGLDSSITSGYLEIHIRTKDGKYESSIRFSFSVVKNTVGVDWIEEWDGTHSQIGENYVITPKLFAGHKTNEGKITGVYLGKLKGFIGEVFPFTLSDPEEGIYGYRDSKVVFYINNYGAKIGGWDITPDSIQCEDGTLTIKSEGSISSQSDGKTHWALNKDGSASFANGKVSMDAVGNASFEGKITATSGKIGNWTIDANSLYNLGISLNADKRFIAIANTTDDLKSGDGQLAKVKNVGGVAMFYSTSADYGIFAYKGKDLVFQAGTTNYIAGWNFDENSLYIGTKNNNADQYTNDDKSLTIGTNGLRSKAWYINTNGTAKFSSGYIQFNEKSGSIGSWNFDSDSLYIGTKNDTSGGFTSANKSITIGPNGIRGCKWRFDTAGSGAIAGGNIKWDDKGNITFGANVVLNWSSGIKEAKDAANTAQGTANTALTNAQTAQQSANSANNAAGSAQSAANTANNKADNAQSSADKAQKAANAANDNANAQGAAAKEFASAMAFGKMLHRDPTFVNGINDIKLYNNSGNGTVTINRVVNKNDITIPNDNKTYIEIVNKGTASPGLGGFSFQDQAGYRKIFVIRIIAWIPVGRYIEFQTNAIGNGGTMTWLTSTAGTGNWAEYIGKVKCGTGSSGNFSSTNFFNITGNFGTSSNPVKWYLAYATVFDITSSERYTTTIDANGIYTSTINANQIVAGTIDADRIGAGSITAGKLAAGSVTADKIAAGCITSSKLDASSIKADIINTSYINGLKLTFDKGTIGGWSIGSDSISKNSVTLGSDGTISNASFWSLKKDGSGFLAKGNISWTKDGVLSVEGEINATSGSIGKWYIVDGVITSDNTGKTVNFVKLDSSNKKIILQTSGASYNDGSYDYMMNSSFGSILTLDGSNGIIEARAKKSPSYSTATSYLSSNGIFSNIAGINGMPASTGYTQRGAIVGLGFANVNKNSWVINADETIVAGVYGRAHNSGTAAAYGGFFYQLKACGLTTSVYYFTDDDAGAQISLDDTTVIGLINKGITCTIYLPKNAHEGQEVEIIQMGQGVTRIDTNDGTHIYDDSSENEYYDCAEGWVTICKRVRYTINNVTRDIWVAHQYRYR
jgi:hypothetical protein